MYHPFMGGGNDGPDLPMALGKIQHMTQDQLREMLSEDAPALEDYIANLPQIKSLYNEKEMLMTSNKSLADYNLSQEPVLKSKRDQLAMKHREVVTLVSSLKKTRSELEAKNGHKKPDDFLYALLQVATAEAEKNSEQLAEEFLAKKIENVDEFIEKFMDKRKLYHSRNVKLNKLKDLIGQKKSQAMPARAAPPRPVAYPNLSAAQFSSTPNSNPATGATPYSVSNPVAPPPLTNYWGAGSNGNTAQPAGVGNLPYPTASYPPPPGVPMFPSPPSPW